jgi:hypothetical protein
VLHFVLALWALQAHHATSARDGTVRCELLSSVGGRASDQWYALQDLCAGLTRRERKPCFAARETSSTVLESAFRPAILHYVLGFASPKSRVYPVQEARFQVRLCGLFWGTKMCGHARRQPETGVTMTMHRSNCCQISNGLQTKTAIFSYHAA